MGFAGILILTVLSAKPARQPTAEELRFFESAIRPVLVEHCHKCHGEKKQWSNFRLDSRDAILKGGDFGPGLVPGKPERVC